MKHSWHADARNEASTGSAELQTGASPVRMAASYLVLHGGGDRRKLARLGHVHRHRLLHEYILALTDELEAHLGVHRVARANDHAVDLVQRLLIRQQLVDRAEHRHALVPLLELRLALELGVEVGRSGGLLTALHDGRDHDVRVVVELREVPAAGNVGGGGRAVGCGVRHES
eukprot:scaffold77829_cov68-Phaeocystis_antarctica.AAC.2